MQGERLQEALTLLGQAVEMLRYFARSAHREEFPHVKPDRHEQEADALITAIASALEGEIEVHVDNS